VEIINSLIKQGMAFTFATARSLDSAYKVTEGLNLKLPVVVYNGTFIMEYSSGKIINENYFSNAERMFVENKINEFNLNPLVYTFINGKERVCWNTDFVNDGLSLYLNSRKGSKRLTPCNGENLFKGNVFYYTIIDKRENLLSFYNEIKCNKSLRVTLQQDIYNEHWWCEVMPAKATKANGILTLKEMYGFDKIISFGDAINDIPMFKISHQCYSVENAVKELKNLSTGVIPSNDNDGVAAWLKENANLK
jgi:Cof subfamily protein (haloacid dehalogenase superfamily)